MLNQQAARRRLEELSNEFDAKTDDHDAGRITTKAYNQWLHQVSAEVDELRAVIKAHDKANRFAAGAEAAMGGNVESVGSAPSDTRAAIVKSLLGPQGQPIERAPSPMDITPDQIHYLYEAMRRGDPFASVEIKATRGAGNVVTKSQLLESGIGGPAYVGNLPPVMSPFAVGLGLEPTRMSSLLPATNMVGPSAAFLTYTSEATSSASLGTPEGATKGTLSPSFIKTQVLPQKIAVQTPNYSLELAQDTQGYGEANFSAWLPNELTRRLVDAESMFLLQATTQATNPISGGPVNASFNGWLNQSGTLTRSVASDPPLVAMAKAYNDIRTGPAFAEPDIVVMNPSSWNALRMLRDDQGRFLMDLLAAPLTLSSNGQPAVGVPASDPNPYSIIPQGTPGLAGSLWHVPVAVTTHCPAGTAIVASLRAGAGIFWVRLGLLIRFNQFGDAEFTTNTFVYQAEERISLSVQRPSALNIVTGLPVSAS